VTALAQKNISTEEIDAIQSSLPSGMWIALWSIVAVVVLAVAAPLIVLIPIVFTLLFIGGGL
jgi:hypothetical protein